MMMFGKDMLKSHVLSLHVHFPTGSSRSLGHAAFPATGKARLPTVDRLVAPEVVED